MINDKRSVETAKQTWGYVVFTDAFMSRWGEANEGRSLYALAVRSPEEAEIVLANGKLRSEMKRGRIARVCPKPRRGDHLTVTDWVQAARWYEKGGFAK